MSFDWSGKGKKEPTADLRVLADINRQVYQAHIDEGFTPREAMEIVQTFMRESIRQNFGRKDDE